MKKGGAGKKQVSWTASMRCQASGASPRAHLQFPFELCDPLLSLQLFPNAECYAAFVQRFVGIQCHSYFISHSQQQKSSFRQIQRHLSK